MKFKEAIWINHEVIQGDFIQANYDHLMMSRFMLFLDPSRSGGNEEAISWILFKV